MTLNGCCHQTLGLNGDAEWKSYPIDVECHAPVGTDRELCHCRLLEDFSRLFINNLGGLRIMRVSQRTEG
jgi:hypothetical protein